MSVTRLALIGALTSAAVLGAEVVTETCKKTNSVVHFQGIPAEDVHYCSKTYNVQQLVTTIEAGELPTYFLRRENGKPLEYYRDSPENILFMSMECQAHQNVVPVSAWFEYYNGVFTEDLARVLGVKGKSSLTLEDSCTGNQISCVRSWHEIFPPRFEEGGNMIRSLLEDMREMESIHLEYLCVPSSTKDAYAPLVTFSDASFSSHVDTFQATQGDLHGELNFEKGQEPRQITIDNSQKVCPYGTSHVEPIAVIDGANCAASVSADLTGAARVACEDARAGDATATGCTVQLPPQISDGSSSNRVPGCLRRRAFAVGRCVMAEPVHRSLYYRLREYVFLKTPNRGGRLLSYNPQDAVKYLQCTFGGVHDLHSGVEAWGKQQVCCFMQSMRMSSTCEERGRMVEYIAAPKSSSADSTGLIVQKWINGFVGSYLIDEFECHPINLTDHSQVLEWRANFMKAAGEVPTNALREVQSAVRQFNEDFRLMLTPEGKDSEAYHKHEAALRFALALRTKREKGERASNRRGGTADDNETEGDNEHNTSTTEENSSEDSSATSESSSEQADRLAQEAGVESYAVLLSTYNKYEVRVDPKGRIYHHGLTINTDLEFCPLIVNTASEDVDKGVAEESLVFKAIGRHDEL